MSILTMAFILMAAAALGGCGYCVSETPELAKHPLRVDGYGAFTGKRLMPLGTDSVVNAWLGVPYAEPPVGDLRFRPPQPARTYIGERQAVEFGNECMQIQPSERILKLWWGNPKYSEDCLNVNVWTPGFANVNSSLPVMVWVYGGGMEHGITSFSLYDGQYLVRQSQLDTPVIVVSINYRVQVFGFLAAKEIADEGGLNAGLLDQKLAFEWVREHIAKFGGNPNSVTAFGQSAGAVTLGSHLVAAQEPSKPPIFDRVILMSGTAIPRIASAHQPHFDRIAAELGCANATSKITCLRAISAARLLATADKLKVEWNTVIDGVYLTQAPHLALAEGSFTKIPALVGGNTDEGTMFARYPKKITDSAGLKTLTERFQPYSEAVLALYPFSDYNHSPFLTAAAIVGDWLFNCPVRDIADAFSNAGLPVYKYRWNYQPWLGKLLLRDLRVFHHSECAFAFHNTRNLAPFTTEKDLASIFVSYLTRFAATGDPNGGRFGNVVWPQYTPASNINGSGTRIRFDNGGRSGVAWEKDDQNVDKCDFWMSYHRNVWQSPGRSS